MKYRSDCQFNSLWPYRITDCDILEQEKYWEEHPGEAVPIMPPKFYWGPWRVVNGEVPRFIQQADEAKAA
jgi:hypothetical protein